MTSAVEDLHSRIFSLEGISCGGCITRLETRLNAVDGVVLARGNATTKRIRLIWDDAKTSSSGLMQTMADLGYPAHPFEGTKLPDKNPTLLGPLAVAGFATMNIMAMSLSVWFGLVTDMGPATLSLMHWISALLCLPVVFYSGAVFYRPALAALGSGRMTMDMPISLAIMVTFAASLFETMRGEDHVYYDAVASLIFLLLIGRVLEQKLKAQSGHAGENLRAMMQVNAQRLTSTGIVETVPADHLLPGDQVLVETGSQIPADGQLESGEVRVDESALTGESLPALRTAGEILVAGTCVAEGPVRMTITHVGDDSVMGKMAALTEEAALHKGHLQQLSDRFATAYVPTVLIGGLAGFVWWYFVAGAGFGDALMIAVAVLVVTCPCAAGLATPAVTSRAVDLLLHGGVLLKSGAALERLGAVERIFVDKTGTLTTAELALPDLPEHTLLAASRLAASSRHPLAMALSKACPAPPLDGAKEVPGKGICAPDGSKLGSAEFVGLGRQDTGTGLWFAEAGKTPIYLALTETPRPGLARMLAGAKKLQLPVTILSGDQPMAVKTFAAQHGISNWQAGLSANQKFDILQGQNAIMFGDGINDTLALSAASVSASFTNSSDIARSAADIVFLHPRLDQLDPIIRLSRQARTLIRQNLMFASFYNLVTVPLALAGFLTPLIAAFLMASSSIIVLSNGLRLRRLT